MKQFREAALEGASSVDLVVALYDGIIRFLLQAAQACAAKDVEARRIAVRRALDIVIHLQATLRPEAGATTAMRLEEFYTATFALVLRASATASAEQFFEAVRCVRNVREAWHKVAHDHRPLPRNLQTHEERMSGERLTVPGHSVAAPLATTHGEQGASNWLA